MSALSLLSNFVLLLNIFHLFVSFLPIPHSPGLSPESLASILETAEWCPDTQAAILSSLTLPGKSYTMIGKDDSMQNLGIIPCAISWLFKLINERKEKTGARFSVRISAVEVWGKEENLRDLLSEVATGSLQDGQSPGVYLCEDPICGTQVIASRGLVSSGWLIPPSAAGALHLVTHSTCKLGRLASVYFKVDWNFMACSCRASCSPNLNICTLNLIDNEQEPQLL